MQMAVSKTTSLFNHKTPLNCFKLNLNFSLSQIISLRIKHIGKNGSLSQLVLDVFTWNFCKIVALHVVFVLTLYEFPKIVY